MTRFFELVMLLYPLSIRYEFGEEMRLVFLAGLPPAGASRLRYLSREFAGLIRGAIWARCEVLIKTRQQALSLLCGCSAAFASQIVAYSYLVPVHRGASLSRIIQDCFSRLLLMLVLILGISQYGSAQPPARQDPSTLETARSIYGRQIAELMNAKTLDDVKRSADGLDAAEWISVDRFGRTVFAKQDRELASMLALPPERRVTRMDILWAEREGDRMIVVAWMMPNEGVRPDALGEYGPSGEPHRLMRATLIRDIFQNTRDGWRRIRHDKILPNDLVLTVDDKPRILPPLGAASRVEPVK